MWLHTDRGFYSAVEDRKNPEMLLIRARISADLDNLEKAVGPLERWVDTSADYHYRARMTRIAFANFAASVAMSVDYDSHFKEVVGRRAPMSENAKFPRSRAMMDVWDALANLQKLAPYHNLVRTLKPGKHAYTDLDKWLAESEQAYPSESYDEGDWTGEDYYPALTDAEGYRSPYAAGDYDDQTGPGYEGYDELSQYDWDLINAVDVALPPPPVKKRRKRRHGRGSRSKR